MKRTHDGAIKQLLRTLRTVTSRDLAEYCGVSREIASDWLSTAWDRGAIAWSGDTGPGGSRYYVAAGTPGALAWHFNRARRVSRAARYPARYDPAQVATYRPRARRTRFCGASTRRRGERDGADRVLERGGGRCG